MPISIVELTNSIEFFRTVTNQCITAINYITNNTYPSVGSVKINPPLTLLPANRVSVNVANGTIYGNAAGIFSIPYSTLTGKFKNSQLQNSSITISSALGVNTNGASILSTKTLLLVANVVDSTSNSRADLPASANAIKSILDRINSIQKNTGRFFPNVGGTGIISYSNGQILLTNHNSLVANTIRSNTGIDIANGPGRIIVTANLIQGQNVILSSSGAEAITITQAPLPAATLTVRGRTSLDDTTLSESTSIGATANSLNSVSNFIQTRFSAVGGTVNAFGRLIDVKTYTSDPFGTPQTFIWTRPEPQANFAFAIVTAVAPGGGSASANNGAGAVSNTVTSMGGGAGASMVGIFTADDIRLFLDNNGANTLTLRIGQVGQGGALGGAIPGNPATNGGNLTIGIRGATTDPPTSYLFHLEGGKAGGPSKLVNWYTDSSITTGLSAPVFGMARAFSNSFPGGSYGRFIMKSSGTPGYPGLVLSQGKSDVTFGWVEQKVIAGQGATPVYPLAIGDAVVEKSQNTGATTAYFETLAGVFNNPLPTLYTNSNTSSNVANMVSRLNFGVGGEGPFSAVLSTTTGATVLRDRPGANGGGGYIKIESYTNA